MLEDILVNLENELQNQSASQQSIKVVLDEIYLALQKLLKDQLASSIDLRPIFSPHQTMELRNSLGCGEVSVKIGLKPTIAIEETGINGVWWITYYDENMKKYCEIIEITIVPEQLIGTYEEIEDSLYKIQMLNKYR